MLGHIAFLLYALVWEGALIWLSRSAALCLAVYAAGARDA